MNRISRFKRALMLCLALLCALPAAGAPQERAALPLRVYLFDPCGGCSSADTGCKDCAIVTAVYGRLYGRFKEEIDAGRLHLRVQNLLYAAVRKEYEGYLKAFDLPEAFHDRVPLYLLGEPGWGAFLVGEEKEPQLPQLAEQVLARMPPDAAWRREPREGQAFIAPRSDDLHDIRPEDSLVIYLFKDYCPYCKELEPFFDALPETVTLSDGSVSRLRFVSLEKQIPAQMAVVQRYYDKLFVHPDRQLVPMVIVGNRALFLREEIEAGLLPALLAGEGLKTDRQALEALR